MAYRYQATMEGIDEITGKAGAEVVPFTSKHTGTDWVFS